MELTFAGLQCRFRALTFGDLFRSDVDADNFAARAAERVPISDPKPFVGLVSALAGNLDTRHRLAGIHDRADDVFDGLGQSRYAFPH